MKTNHPTIPRAAGQAAHTTDNCASPSRWHGLTDNQWNRFSDATRWALEIAFLNRHAPERAFLLGQQNAALMAALEGLCEQFYAMADRDTRLCMDAQAGPHYYHKARSALQLAKGGGS